ncbi:hypothetical protein SDC9_199287 [bioreactor metagenome]|uniref:HEAT repeat domain-containing protein n=1 Tax=bioreactor metagenome TaxID=1076179 RepID=A0A645IK13_9ZZZZ
MLPFLGSSELNARIDAVRTLGQLREHEAIEPIRAFAKDIRWEMRAVTATALGALSARENVELLITLLCDRDWWVRYRAAEALLSYPNRALLMHHVEDTFDRFPQEMMAFALDKEALAKEEAV